MDHVRNVMPRGRNVPLQEEVQHNGPVNQAAPQVRPADRARYLLDHLINPTLGDTAGAAMISSYLYSAVGELCRGDFRLHCEGLRNIALLTTTYAMYGAARYVLSQALQMLQNLRR